MVKPIIKKLMKKGFEIKVLGLNNYGRRRLSFNSGRIGEVMHDLFVYMRWLNQDTTTTEGKEYGYRINPVSCFLRTQQTRTYTNRYT